VRTGQQHFGLGVPDARGEIRDDAAQFGRRVFVGLGKLEQDGRILDGSLEPVGFVDGELQAASRLQQLLRLLLVVPQVGIGDALLELGELFALAIGVKETSAARTPAVSDRRIVL